MTIFLINDFLKKCYHKYTKIIMFFYPASCRASTLRLFKAICFLCGRRQEFSFILLRKKVKAQRPEWMVNGILLLYPILGEISKYSMWYLRFSSPFLLKEKAGKVQDTAIFSAHCGKRRKYCRRDEISDFETQALLPISYVVSLVSDVTRSAPCRACTLRLFKAIFYRCVFLCVSHMTWVNG